MPPITPSHVYALSTILPFTQTSIDTKHANNDDYKSTIKTTPFLNALALLLVQKPKDDFAAVSISRDPPYTRLYYVKSQEADAGDTSAVDKIKQTLFNTRIDHAAEFLSLSTDICIERILSRAAVLGLIGRSLGITPDTPDGDFTTICVPDEETIWKYITSKYVADGLGRSSLRCLIRSLFLDYPKLGMQKEAVEVYLRMTMLLAEMLSNGLEFWGTGTLAVISLENNEGKCGIFLAKKEFGASGVELENVYQEAEELMGKVVDAVQEIGAYAKAAADIAEFINRDIEFRKSVLERRVVFKEVKPTAPVAVDIIGKPVDLLNKFLRKSGRAAVTDSRILRAFPAWPESRIKAAGTTIPCKVHCELELIQHVLQREHNILKADRVDLKYGSSEPSCYLCEVYIEALQTHLVGEELKRFLVPENQTERQQGDTDELSSIVSHLKGFTAQPGKTLRGWFSGATQQEDEPALPGSSKESSKEHGKEKEKGIANAKDFVTPGETFENPGYSRGYRRLCAEWQFPKDTPAVVRKEVEKNIEGKLRYIYAATRTASKKNEELTNDEAGLPPTILKARNNVDQ